MIVTNPGGTGGTGTAMGTSGYCYYPSDHWLIEIIENGIYMRTYQSGERTYQSGERINSPKRMHHEGRLTKEVKNKMIAFTEELRNKTQ